MYEDKIVRGGEITANGDFKSPNGAFFIMPLPKSEDAAAAMTMTVKLSMNDTDTEYPFMAGIWNPVVINKVTIDGDILTIYRIFWGETL